jgi:hypothetical protein
LAASGATIVGTRKAAGAGLTRHFQWKAFTAVLAKGEKKNRQVTFQPTSTAISQGTLKVVSTGSGSPHSIDFLGKGAGGFPVPVTDPDS